MPFYEYECQACKYYTEVMQKISDAPLVKCPSCGKRALKKLVSAPVFRLKGAGWYETDFKSDKENKRNLAGAEKEEAKSETKSESKDATKEAKDAQAPKDAKDSKESKDAKPSDSKAPAAASPRRAQGAPVKSRARKASRAPLKSARKRRR
jgi:putative FmdB family regulatory protein